MQNQLPDYVSEPVNFSENALKVLEKRYLKRDENGIVLETPQEMFYRTASVVAQADMEFGASKEEIESLTKEFYLLMTKKYFMPNSPALMNAGRELGQLAACFVLPVEDSLDGIFETLKHTALIHQSGGGTGFSFSRLRPKNDIVRSTMGVSSGPVSFMEVYNAATEAVKQGGTRRGANMGILRVDHPDIFDFITCKSNNDKLNNFNISVAVTDKFMEALKNDAEYELVNPHTKQVVKTVRAKEVFEKITESAWRNGEPGIIFIDKINKYNPTPLLGEIESTNPCGEVPLLPYEACNLGSVNLGLMFNENENDVDWELLRTTVRMSVHFLDNVISANKYPLSQIEETVKNNRKIGLGIMGWADLLMKLEIGYDSDQAGNLASRIMEFVDYHSKLKSVELAQKRGRFNNFQGSIYDGKNYLAQKFKNKSAGKITDEMWAELEVKIQTEGIRNATTTCIAPTGTISMIAGASGGIEPLFGLVFERNIMDGTLLTESNPIFKAYAEKNGFYSQELVLKAFKDGSIAHCENVPRKAKQIFVCAHDVSPENHVKMQAAFQFHTDNAVSKTVNFPENATREEIAKTYLLAYENELKGITVYRNNSRSVQPMNLQSEPKSEHKCPECGTVLGHGEGCYLCPNCGYSGCS